MSDEATKAGCVCLGWILGAFVLSVFFPIGFWPALGLMVILGLFL